MHSRRSFLALILIALLGLLLTLSNPPVRADVAYLASGASVYLPFVTRPAAVDLVLNQVEITQSVQNSSNSVPLVAGRATVMRVYVTVSGAAELSDVVVELQQRATARRCPVRRAARVHERSQPALHARTTPAVSISPFRLNGCREMCKSALSLIPTTGSWN